MSPIDQRSPTPFHHRSRELISLEDGPQPGTSLETGEDNYEAMGRIRDTLKTNLTKPKRFPQKRFESTMSLPAANDDIYNQLETTYKFYDKNNKRD